MVHGPDSSYLIAHERFLRSLAGQTITGTRIGQWSVELMLDTASVRTEGSWRLTDAGGEIIDSHQDVKSRESFELWRVVGKTLDEIAVETDQVMNLTLKLSNGWELEALGNEDGMEDWEVTSYRGGYSVICNGTV